MHETMIPCPKCRRPGTLYSQRSISALIGSKHVAHVLHARSKQNRHICLLTRLELERIRKQVTTTQGIAP